MGTLRLWFLWKIWRLVQRLLFGFSGLSPPPRLLPLLLPALHHPTLPPTLRTRFLLVLVGKPSLNASSLPLLLRFRLHPPPPSRLGDSGEHGDTGQHATPLLHRSPRFLHLSGRDIWTPRQLGRGVLPKILPEELIAPWALRQQRVGKRPRPIILPAPPALGMLLGSLRFLG
jgi:hypothetical protein